MARIRYTKHLTRGLTILIGGCVAVALGLVCLEYSFAQALARLSYDLPFIWRTNVDTHEISLVYLDEASAKQLQQPLDDRWDRTLHARLLDRLTNDKARLVLFDIVFDAPSADEAIDSAFAQTIQRHGAVVLGGTIAFAQQMGLVAQQRVLPPVKTLRKAAAGWGLLLLEPLDPDYAIRQLSSRGTNIPNATWKAAELLSAPVTHDTQSTAQRWINYYGPRDSFSSVSFAQALAPDGVRPGYFRDRIVVVGSRFAISYLAAGRDEFATPYSRWNQQFSPGAEVQATILLNLLRGDWLTRMSAPRETSLLVAIGLLAGLLAVIRPPFAVMIGIAASLGVTCLAFWLVWAHRVWFAWVIPAGLQIPFGVIWSVGSHYLLESRRRKELRKAFGFYLSPEMADMIANSDFDLTPGGKLVEATIIFTDLENFTTLSEDLDPHEVSQILIAYFEQTTRCILENKGTIIKYVGDAVMAAWGAPIDQPAHALQAAEAACDLRELTELEVRGKKLRTRVGVNTGEVLAGNLGSSFRFDYTMIGDTTNFASRLESLNKYLSTQVLIADSVRQQLGDKFVTRRLGEFRVAGKTRSVKIHELICRADGQQQDCEWIAVFEQALEVFHAGDFQEARALMEKTREMRGGSDGPSQFYLKKIDGLQTSGRPNDWSGVVEFSEK
jgi:adenylate cyclase